MQYLRGFIPQRYPGNSVTLTALWIENLKKVSTKEIMTLMISCVAALPPHHLSAENEHE